MFEILYRRKADVVRHRAAPFAEERERYLRHCAEQGGTWGRLRTSAKWMRWAAVRMSPNDCRGVNAARLHELVRGAGLTPESAETYEQSIRPWWKFMGWWHEESKPVPFGPQLEQFISWMRDERGLSANTIDVRRRRIAGFLHWCADTRRDLAALRPEDLDAYFISSATQRWSRVSVASMATGLRVFLRHAASTGACPTGLAESIVSPTTYKLASLPYALSWEDVRRVLASASSDTPRDVRDRAILMLLAIYGWRRCEVAALRLDQIDWTKRQLHAWRSKCRQTQVYPLQTSVAEALARYIDTVRPAVAHPEVFIHLQAPRRPISPPAIYYLVSRRLRALDIQAAHLGPHALRHACASKLLADGLTLKEIGDHLGHHSTSATMIYTKVDLGALREVGDFDLGGLQ